jgi:hypothetical protein
MGDTTPSGGMEVISADVKWDVPKRDDAFMQGCGSGIQAERDGRGAFLFANATKLAKEALPVALSGQMVKWVSASSFNVVMS